MNKLANNVMQAVRQVFKPLIELKHAYLNPHEHFGRANITRAVILTYISAFMAVKWNGKRKAKALEEQKVRERQNVVNDALARAGLA